MNSKFKHLIYVVIASGAPVLLSTISNSSTILEKLQMEGILGDSINIVFVKEGCLWAGMVISAIFLSYNLWSTRVKYDVSLEQRDGLLSMTKKIFGFTLKKKKMLGVSDFNIRLFVPKYPKLYKLAEKLHLRKVKKRFIIKNIKALAEQGITKNLQFEVSPHVEGLVGQCFNQQAIVYDDDLEETNSINYHLNPNQKSRTSSLKWSICCPIFDDKQPGTVVAILALDGNDKVSINDGNKTELTENIQVFSQQLYDAVGPLFMG